MKAFAEKYRYQIILFLSAFLLYGTSLKNDYSLDDEFVTGPNSITSHGIKAIPRIFKSFHVQDESKNNYEYRPIVKVAYAVEATIFGVNPHVSHFFNVFLYGICLLLLFRFLKLLLPNLPVFTIFLIVLVFASLPMHSEVVVSLKNRDVLLCFIFTMVAFYNAIKFADNKKWYNFLLIFVGIFLAFLSKYDVLPYLVIGPMCLYQRNKLNLKFIFALVVVFIAALYSTKFLKRSMLRREDVARVFLYFESPLYFDKSVSLKLSAALNSLGFYAKMLIWPNPMSCYYGFNVIKVYSFTSVFALTGLASIAGFGYLFFKKFKTPDLMWYGILFFAVSISMYLNLTPAPGIVADRFVFFASIGFAMIISQLLFLDKKTKRYPTEYKNLNFTQKGILGVAFLCYIVLIVNRTHDWRSKLSVFEVDSKNYPESVKLAQLSTSQLIVDMPKKDGPVKENEKYSKVREAEAKLIRAVKIDSSCIGCFNNLGFLFLSYDQSPAEALIYLRKGFKGDSTKKEVACNLGIAYLRLNKTDSAEIYLKKAIDLDKEKSFLVPYEALQALYAGTNVQKGIQFLKEKIEEEPNSEGFNILLAKTYWDIKDTANSLIYYKRVLQINPANQTVSEFLNKVEILQNKKYF